MEDILSMIIFFPFFTALLLGIFRVNLKVLRIGAFVSAHMVLFMTIYIIFNFDPSGGIQFEKQIPWITSYGITFNIGIDGLSLVLLTLIAIIMPPVYLYMFDEKREGYWYNMMMLQTAVLGAVCSFDLILFYVFWEMMLLPIFIMIGRYGNTMHHYNAMKIVLITVFGSMMMLYSILYLGYNYFEINGVWSFSLADLKTLTLDTTTALIVASGFLLAFSIKIPIIGFHTWLAPAYSSSPTPAVVILSSIMAKIGVYGILRFGYPLFENAILLYTPLIIFATISGMIFYAIHAINEDDIKKLFAYSSASHLSLITLGLVIANSYSWNGSLYFIGTHALSSAGIFLMAGLIYKKSNTLNISKLGGIATVAPKFTFFFVFFSLSIVGIPGTGGFVAELLLIISAFKYNTILGVFTSLTMIMAIMFIFWMLQKTVFGKVKDNTKEFEDLSSKEIVMLLPFFILLIATGIFPSFFMDFYEPLIETILNDYLTTIGAI